MKKGHIIWLNGVSSSGKSSLTEELQMHESVQDTYLKIKKELIFTI